MIKAIADLPDGYIWWRNLPKTGRQSSKHLRKQWAVQLVKAFFPLTFLRAMVLACVDTNGVPDPRGAALFDWLLRHIYRGQPERLYKDWFSFTVQTKKGT